MTDEFERQVLKNQEYRKFLTDELRNAPDWALALYLRQGEAQDAQHLSTNRLTQGIQDLRTDLLERLSVQDTAIQTNQAAIQANQKSIETLEEEVRLLKEATAIDVDKEIEQNDLRKILAGWGWLRTTILAGVVSLGFLYLGTKIKACDSSAPTPAPPVKRGEVTP